MKIPIPLCSEPADKSSIAGRTVSTTVSVGLCATAATSYDFEHHLRKADEALYQAKSAGRNQVVLYREP